MKKEIIKITPSKAKALLENHKNRPVKQSVVDEIVDDMKNGQFDTMNTNVVLNEDGTLNYGQHTLHAIIKYGKGYDVCVITLASNDKHYKGVLNQKSKYNRLFFKK